VAKQAQSTSKDKQAWDAGLACCGVVAKQKQGRGSFQSLLAVSSLGKVQSMRPPALPFLRWTRRGKDLQKEQRKQQRKAQMYGEHIDQHIQHWPGGIWWLFGGEQGVKAKKGRRKEKGEEEQQERVPKVHAGRHGWWQEHTKEHGFVLKTFWSEMSEIVKANCKELIYVRESAQSPSLGDPGNIHRQQQQAG
jgi:hypothetical protein